MPERQTLQRAQRDKREGKSASTQAGEFVREEVHHIREGKHGARSSRQAIAIGLSKARRAGVELAPPAEGRASESTARKARRDYARGHGASPRRKVTARRRAASEGSATARKAAQTKGPTRRSSAARKAAHTRSAHRGGSRQASSRSMQV